MSWSLSATAAAEDAYFESLPTILSASRLPQAIHEAPGAITVIDRDFIRATGYRDLARLFRLVPGMQVGQERGSSQWVTYHGLSTTYPSEMQVLIDGRSVYSPASFGGVDWLGLPVTPDDIERIEIVRGSNPVTYGANAFMGVINLITRHSAEPVATRAALSGGRPGLLDASLGGGARVGAASYAFSALRRRDDGFRGLHDRSENSVLSLRGDLRVSARDELSLRLGGADTRREAGYAQSMYNNNGLREPHGQNFTLHAQWRRMGGPGEEWLLSYYRNQERLAERWDARGPASAGFPDGPAVPIDLNRRATRDHFELQRRHQPGERVQAVWGGEWRRDVVHAPFLYAGQEDVATRMGRLFGNVEWKFAPAWQLTSGAALEQFEHEPSHLAPRVFLNWQASRSDTLRVGAARAWTQRPTFEKEGDVRAVERTTGVLIQQPYVPNPELRQARVDSVEAGYLGRFRPLEARLDVRLFRERITDFIYREAALSDIAPALASAEDSARYANAADAVVLTGAEYQLRVSPWRGADLLLNHAVMRVQAQPALRHRAAPYVASLSWRQAWGGGWSSMLTGLRMGPLAGGDGIIPIHDYVARAYTTFDARVAWARRAASGARVEYSLNAINLGGRHQEIADRSLQRVVGERAANRVSAMVYGAVAVEF